MSPDVPEKRAWSIQDKTWTGVLVITVLLVVGSSLWFAPHQRSRFIQHDATPWQRQEAERLCASFGGVKEVQGCFVYRRSACLCQDDRTVEHEGKPCDEICRAHGGPSPLEWLFSQYGGMPYTATAFCADGSRTNIPPDRGQGCVEDADGLLPRWQSREVPTPKGISL